MRPNLDLRSVRAVALMLATVTACSPASMVDVDPPGNVVDPTTIATPDGALQMYAQAVTTFATRLGGWRSTGRGAYIEQIALFTDELLAASVTEFGGWGYDQRITYLPGTFPGNYYENLHHARHQTRQAREALARFAPDAPRALQARLAALEAQTILWFAEFYCSGIPLSTLSVTGEISLSPGLTTDELFERAAALADSAIALAGDSVRFLDLARVTKARALLGLGRFDEAAAAVQDVLMEFVYHANYSTADYFGNWMGWRPQFWQVVDNEGINGLVWSTDPRAAITTTPAISGPMPISGKYSRTGASELDPTQSVLDNPIRVADGLEARLIEAEAAIANGSSAWLTTLNELRSSCVGDAECAPVPGMTSTSLPPLADPGTPEGRLDLLMKERAMWMYLTGHRQGDLRRLARVYRRDPSTLWPTGTYINPGFSGFRSPNPWHGNPYGQAVVWIPNLDSETQNPLWTGCFNLDP